jgi:hypothetical protein
VGEASSFIVWGVPLDEQETNTIATTESTETRMMDFFIARIPPSLIHLFSKLHSL